MPGQQTQVLRSLVTPFPCQSSISEGRLSVGMSTAVSFLSFFRSEAVSVSHWTRLISLGPNLALGRRRRYEQSREDMVLPLNGALCNCTHAEELVPTW